jgi:nonsense-mediated mRNA decay protein 3
MVRDISKKHPGYYEAVLQLRDCNEEVVSFVEGEIIREGIHVAKTEELKKGLDLYLADNNFTKGLGKRLQEKFGGDLKVTASLWGRKDGKEVYRVTVMFRSVGFKKGDIVVYEGEEYKVKIMGKDIMLQKVKTGEKVHVRYKEIERIRKKDFQ